MTVTLKGHVMAGWHGPIDLKGKQGVPGQPGEDGADGMSIPGTPGVTGVPGQAGIPGQAGEDGEMAIGIPGLPGAAGAAGAAGATGAAGSAGATGSQGPAGPPGIGQDGDDGEIRVVQYVVPAQLPTFGFALTNGSVDVSASGGVLTIQILCTKILADGSLFSSTPNADNPVFVEFYSAAAAIKFYKITSLTKLDLSSGSTLGVAANVPFRLWFLGINDSDTTFRMGAVLCTTLSNAGVMASLPIRDNSLLPVTAEGGAGGADSAQVIYAAAAVTTGIFRILGFAEWESGLATPGTWVAPTRTQQYKIGDPLPGDVIQTQISASTAYATNAVATLIPFDDTIPQNTEGDQYFSQAIVPSSKANILECEVDVFMFCSVAGAGVVALFQDSTANAFACCMVGQSTGSGPWRQRLLARILPGTTGSTTIKMRGGNNNVGSVSINGLTGRLYGGVQPSFLSVKEIMA